LEIELLVALLVLRRRQTRGDEVLDRVFVLLVLAALLSRQGAAAGLDEVRAGRCGDVGREAELRGLRRGQRKPSTEEGRPGARLVEVW
jgi:hypothetical protein